MFKQNRLFSRFSLLYGLLLLGVFYGCSAHLSLAPEADDFNRFAAAAQLNYPDAQYLSAIGDGSSLSAARESAQGAIAQIFSARIEEDLLVNQEVLSINDKDIQSEYLSRSVLVSARSEIKGIEVPETLYSEGRNLYFALAVLNRDEAERRWLDALRPSKRTIATLEADLEQPNLPPYRIIYKLRELHQTIVNHNQHILRLQIVKPQAGYRARQDNTARRLRAIAQTMSFAVTTTDPDMKLWIVAALTEEGMKLADNATADLLIESELEALPFSRLDEWFIAHSSLVVQLSYRDALPQTIEWKPKATSIRQEEAEKRMHHATKELIHDDLFGAMIDELNRE